ncbi:hypothetical protein [Anaeromyxobacter paludicola]|nr:hypothetical protein [Anaeromyxobacter paludicola]
MKLVAVVRTPEHPEDAARAVAAATGVTLAEGRMRLAPEPPALVTRAEEGPAESLVAALTRCGVAALAVDAAVPTDADRVVADRFSLESAGLSVRPAFGEDAFLPWPEVLAILRGLRASRTQVERDQATRSFSVGLAVATGGLRMTRQTEKTVRSSEETAEQVILVYARDGRCFLVSEHRLDVSCLGPGLHPSSAANMAEVARLLRARAPAAFHDDRLLRLGRRPLPFVAGGESRSTLGTTTVTRTDSRGSLDVLAEVMRRAVALGLLP